MYISDSVEQIGDRYYIKATVSLTDCESGEKLENTAFTREPVARKGMDESQITGTASSYAKKYALNGLFCIDDCKDADTNECAKEIESKPITEYNCRKCGQVVIGAKKPYGTTATAAEVYAITGGLCLKCANEKGRMIIVEGSLRNNDYTDQNGVKHYSMNVQADSVAFGESKNSSGNQPQNTYQLQKTYKAAQQTLDNFNSNYNIGDLSGFEVLSDAEPPF